MSPLRKYSQRVAKWWVLVVVLAVAGGLLSAVWSIANATTTWTATTALSTQSQTRAPEQDGVLAIGYVDYFNQDNYQQLLRAQANVPEDVTLSAQTAASSPIIYIQASGGSEGVVRESAAAAAEAFREHVRQSLVAERRQAADDLQAEIDRNVATLNSLAGTDLEENVILDQIRSLQGRLTEFLADNTNHLKQLQPEPAVSTSTPSPVVDIVSGVLGGGVLGILIALVIAVFDRRVLNSGEAQEVAGAPVLAELQRGDDSVSMQNLLNIVTTAGRATTVVAVVCVRRSEGLSAFANGLASAWPARRGGALHVLADLRSPRPGYDGSPGLVDVLDGRRSLFGTAVARTDGLWVLPPGDVADFDPYALADPRLVAGVLQDASRAVALVVVEAPPLLEAPESQSVCAAADRVIVLVDAKHTRSDDLSKAVGLLRSAEKAVGLLRSAEAEVAGIVIDGTGGDLAARVPAPATAGAAPQGSPLTPRADAAVRTGAADDRPTPYRRAGLVGAVSNGLIESNGSKDGT